ncbi:hypothetical protein [Faecalibacterium sp. PGM34]
MKNNATCTIRSEEITIDVRICAALAANRGGEVISLTIDEVYLFQKYLASHSITLMADDQKLPCICID